MRVASKGFTESVILAEIATQLLRHDGVAAAHRRQLGGTRILWNALLEGRIDIYPEYSGTLSQEIFGGRVATDLDTLRREADVLGLRIGAPLGFNNTYALGMREDTAAASDVRRISDLVAHADFELGFSNEFMDRGDGWPGLRVRYGLPQRGVRGLDHDLAYRALQGGDIEVIDLYSTDAEIRYYGLRVLEDDLGYFPRYDAVLVYRADLARRAPRVEDLLQRLEGRVEATAMIAMNGSAKLDRVPENVVAAGFLAQTLGLTVDERSESFLDRLGRNTAAHLALVGISLAAAIAVAIPLGILASRRRGLGRIVLGAAGVVQTVPSLALLVFMIPLLGIGAPPAILALFLYSLLPIVRNTVSGLDGIPRSLIDSADALGLPGRARLWRIELPLASRTILAGIKTSAVINVGTATLGALIGAGGYGQPILTGIRLDDTGLILEGAVPAALLALTVSGLFELTERRLLPRGLR
ncbi:MAG: ABC transporter permease subunit [bacterium]|nr:ABC transporter permease subunit [bacterium]